MMQTGTTPATGIERVPPRGSKVLRSELWVPADPATVWPFFGDPANLELLTPPLLRFEILTPQPIRMAADTRIDYRLRVHGIPLRWRTRIAVWQPPVCFVDEQERGPYRLWRHTHTFAPAAGGTLLADHVEFTVRGGLLAPLLSRLFVERDLLRIFRFRLIEMAKRFGGDAAKGRVHLERAIALATA